MKTFVSKFKATKANLAKVSEIIGDKGFCYKCACNQVKFRIYGSGMCSEDCIKDMFPQFEIEGDVTTLYDYNLDSYTYIVLEEVN